MLTHASVAVIYCCLFGMGVARAFSAPAISSMLPTLVARENFVNANAYVSSGFELASIAGPALAGGIIWWTGGATAVYAIYSILSATFLTLLLAAASTTSTGEARPGARRFRFSAQDTAAPCRDRARHLCRVARRRDRTLADFSRKIFCTWAQRGLGWLRAAPSFGAVIMALVTTRRAPWRRPGMALLVTVVGFGARRW